MLGIRKSVSLLTDVEVRVGEFRFIKASEIVPVEPPAFRYSCSWCTVPRSSAFRQTLYAWTRSGEWSAESVNESLLDRVGE